MALKFYPAKHNKLFIWIFQNLNFIELCTRVQFNILPSDIETLRTIPLKTNLILIANHSDELDPRVIMELSRRSGRRFTFMVNSEVFKEWFGTAKFCLQHIGSFSVERGASDQVAIQYAIDTVKNTNNILIMFPEGEIYNLNDSVQPFKTGAVHIGLEALKEIYAESSDQSVSILPAAIKYRYKHDIMSTLKKRIIKMEKHLSIDPNILDLQHELYRIMNKLMGSTNNAEAETEDIDTLIDRLEKTRESIVTEIEKKYTKTTSTGGDLFSRAQKMIFFIREQISKQQVFSKDTQKQLEQDLQAMKKTIQMATWQPQYIELNPSEEHLAETVMKLEKAVFNKKRVPALGKREVFIRLLDPVDLSVALESYEADPLTVMKNLSEELRTNLQEAIESNQN